MDDLAEKFSDLTHQYGSSVKDAALSAARIEGYSILSSSILSIGASILFYAIAKKLLRISIPDNDSGNNDLKEFGILVFFILSGITIIPAIWALIDPWTWTAIYHPELYIAKRVIFGH